MKNVKAGDFIVNTDGDEAKVFYVFTDGFVKSCWNDLEEVEGYWYTWEEAEQSGWKIKSAKDDTIITIGGKKYKITEI